MSGLDSEKPIRDTYTRNKILGRQAQQLANIDNIKASKHIGSITFSDEDGKTVIGPTTGDGTRHMPLLGPFDNARDYYVAWCEEHLKLIADRQLCVRFPINAYLIYKYLKKTAEEGRWDNFEGKYENGPFSTKQVEDDDWEPIYSAELTNGIVGPTGWKYARVVPRYEAFGPSLFAVDMKKMQNGEIYENEDDGDLTRYLKKERKSLVKFHGQPDKIRRLMFGLNCGRDIKWEQALQLLRAMNFHLQRKLELRTDWNARWDWEDLRKEWMEEHKYDERLQSLRADVKKKPGLESWNQRDRSILD
ncbi:hypothetical protein K490DRAFT_50028 [Saccharata proteae CBS 121410]|uniref:Uncharacterized protein n=1 Tax=Saccharata proteae CBS 121410 TaxID=1314787 RepID=A0A9P4LUD8_9PEZI|nr:hypothetical protein K490DRAFT_50028 [Saccharata proteae CBS 121410]